VHIGDGNAFVSEKHKAYDVIIVDSSDPIGPGEALFEKSFYENLKQALKPGGVIATQGESFFLYRECVENLINITRDLFHVRGFANILVPTYPGGHIGVCMGSLGPQLVRPAREVTPEIQARLKYYSPEVHKAAFVLPYFASQIMTGVNNQG
jgi:spermidine synthase